LIAVRRSSSRPGWLRYLVLGGSVLLALFNGSLYSPIYDSVDQILYLFSRSSVHTGPLPLQPYRTSMV